MQRVIDGRSLTQGIDRVRQSLVVGMSVRRSDIRELETVMRR
jgi:hypothetical protein